MTKMTSFDILRDFVNKEGVVRILVSTVAFGMGVDAPNIRHIIHWGAPRSIEMYVQENPHPAPATLEQIFLALPRRHLKFEHIAGTIPSADANS